MTLAPPEIENSACAPPATTRLVSLDAFRGLVIALMFLVNLSGNRDAFPQWFGHAGWNIGRHGHWLADFVFPWFLFIVGVGIPFSMQGGRGRSLSTGAKVLIAVRRGVVLYLLGVVIFMARSSMDSLAWQGGRFVPQPGVPITWSTILHWDILPLIGLGYALGVILSLLGRSAQVAFVVLVLVAKWLSMPDLTATVGLDRATWMASRTDLESSFRSWGWIGTAITQGLPATAVVVLGALTGDALRSRERSTRWLAVIAAAGLAAFIVALAWSTVFPFSKDFFTSTYVLLCAGSGVLVLALAAWLLDSSPSRPVSAIGRFFVVLGSNAITVYFVGEILWTMVWMRWRVMAPGDLGGQVLFVALQAHFSALVRPLLGDPAGGIAGPWLATATYLSVYWLLCLWLWRRRWFIKV